jgi:hypothetical protein
MYQVLVGFATPGRTAESTPLPYSGLVLSDEWAAWVSAQFTADANTVNPSADSIAWQVLNAVKNGNIAPDGPEVTDMITFLQTLGQWLPQIVWQIVAT